MSKQIYFAVAVLLFLAGLAVFLYPHIQGAALERESSQAVEDFRNTWTTPQPMLPPATEPELSVTPTPMPHAELYETMAAYNESIYHERQERFSDPWAYANPGLDLSLFGQDSCVIGVISIPALELEMPLYLGATQEHLAAGAAVLGQASLPLAV